MEYSQNQGFLSGMQPGERVRDAVGGDAADLGQNGPGPLGGGQPGERVREVVGGDAADLGQEGGPLGTLDVPSNPGPAAAGRTPLVGTLRRSNGMPVARDQLSGMMG